MSEPKGLQIAALPDIEPRHYRDAIGFFATGIAVIVGQTRDEVLAMTMNSVTSVSLDPMLLLFCPGKKTRFAQSLDRFTSFTINFLRFEQHALATYFAGAWKEGAPPSFRFIPTASAPRLDGCLASIECVPDHMVEKGDHWLVFGRVTALHIGDEPHRALVFYRGGYHSIDVAKNGMQANSAHVLTVL